MNYDTQLVNIENQYEIKSFPKIYYSNQIFRRKQKTISIHSSQ